MPRTDPDGFHAFVTSRSAALLRSAWLLTGDAGKAEDLLQTALASAWRRWSHISVDHDPERYVRRILYTTYATWWRRRWRAEVPTEFVPEHRDNLDLASEEADRDIVRRALATLSRQQRSVVVLRYVEERTVADTAELLGCSVDTVKVQSKRALDKLRECPHLSSIVTAEMEEVHS